MIGVDDIARVVKAQLAAASIPKVGWATVVSTSPLRIAFPGEAVLDITPPALCRPAVDDDVLAAQWGKQTVVLGAKPGVWHTSGFVFAGGWADLGLAAGGPQRCAWTVMGGCVFVRLGVRRDGGDILASLTGHLEDVDVVTLPRAARPPGPGQWPVMWRTSTSSGGGLVETAASAPGMVRLADLNSRAAVLTGNTMSASLIYPAQ